MRPIRADLHLWTVTNWLSWANYIETEVGL
jgi:hypothetical protein